MRTKRKNCPILNVLHDRKGRGVAPAFCLVTSIQDNNDDTAIESP